MTFASGENVGPYRIIEQLGQGGMATVYKAYHAALDRYVAIKVLHPAFLADENFLKRFQREAKAVARLEHPNIVPIYDFADHGGHPYLVMKFIEGDTLKARLLKARLHESALSTEEGLHIVEAAGAALSYAHRHAVLHRDIKPSNFLLAPDGMIYLADFGLARIGASESTLSADVMLGTPQYISPEQARGDKELDAGTDIYSFGVVLYEMVVGRVPFSADTPFSIIHDHIYKPLPIPSKINPHVPQAVERVLLKALDKDRSARFATVDDMVAAFRAAVTGTGEAQQAAVAAPAPPALPGAAAAPGPSTEPPTPPKRRVPWPWIGAGLAALCLCGFVFLGLARRDGQAQSAGEEATAQALITDADAQPPPSTGQPGPIPTESPDVLEARQKVFENPDDPNAHLVLAEALRLHEFNRLAMEEYLKAAELFLTRGADLDAAMAALEALHLGGGPGEAGPGAENLAVRASFLAADNPAIAPLLRDADNRYPGWEPLPAIAARAALYLEGDEDADRWLGVALENQPGDPMARAVRAEALYLRGEPVQGQAFARQILEQPRIPPWLVEHLNQMIANPPVR